MLKSLSLRSLEDWKGSARCARLRRYDFLFDGKFFRQRKAQKQLLQLACDMLSCPACFKPSLRSAQRSIRPSFTSQLFIALFYIAGRDHERGGVISFKVLPVEGIRLSVHSWDCSLIQSNLVYTKVRNASSALWTLLWLGVVHEDIYGKVFVL